MGLILNQLFSLIKLLNSETGTNQIAVGVALGFILGMTPAFSLQTLLVIFVLFFFRIQIGAALVSAFFFKFIAFFFDGVLHEIGAWTLQIEALNSFYTALYNMPIIPYTRFNNTIVMGAAVFSILMFPFIFLGSRILIQKYRQKIVERFKETKFWKAVKATGLYKWYYKYDQIAN